MPNMKEFKVNSDQINSWQNLKRYSDQFKDNVHMDINDSTFNQAQIGPSEEQRIY